jgi:hypothetical protein
MHKETIIVIPPATSQSPFDPPWFLVVIPELERRKCSHGKFSIAKFGPSANTYIAALCFPRTLLHFNNKSAASVTSVAPMVLERWRQ